MCIRVRNNRHGNINKICCLIYKKSADKIIEDRTCSILADKRSTKSAIFAWHTTDFCRAILSVDKIGRFCRSSDIPFSLLSSLRLADYSVAGLLDRSVRLSLSVLFFFFLCSSVIFIEIDISCSHQQLSIISLSKHCKSTCRSTTDYHRSADSRNFLVFEFHVDIWHRRVRVRVRCRIRGRVKVRIKVRVRVRIWVIYGAIHWSEIYKPEQYLPSQMICGDDLRWSLIGLWCLDRPLHHQYQRGWWWWIPFEPSSQFTANISLVECHQLSDLTWWRFYCCCSWQWW